MPIYLKIDGIQAMPPMKTQELDGYRSYSLECQPQHEYHGWLYANREASEPMVSEVILTKVSDSSSTKLFRTCAGRTGKTAVIHLVTTGNPGNTYIEYNLTNTLIANYSVDSSGDRPVETIKLNFTKIEVKYTPYDENNTAKSPMIASYDLSTTKAA